MMTNREQSEMRALRSQVAQLDAFAGNQGHARIGIESSGVDPGDVIPMKITAVDGSTPANYSWTEQTYSTADGTYADMPGGRVGTATTTPARERNGVVAANFPFYVEAARRMFVNGQPMYEFDAPPSAGGSALCAAVAGCVDAIADALNAETTSNDTIDKICPIYGTLSQDEDGIVSLDGTPIGPDGVQILIGYKTHKNRETGSAAIIGVEDLGCFDPDEDCCSPLEETCEHHVDPEAGCANNLPSMLRAVVSVLPDMYGYWDSLGFVAPFGIPHGATKLSKTILCPWVGNGWLIDVGLGFDWGTSPCEDLFAETPLANNGNPDDNVWPGIPGAGGTNTPDWNGIRIYGVISCPVTCDDGDGGTTDGFGPQLHAGPSSGSGFVTYYKHGFNVTTRAYISGCGNWGANGRTAVGPTGQCDPFVFYIEFNDFAVAVEPA